MLQHETWPIDKLIEYARNPRKNDHAVDRVAAAIREFGFRVPVVAKSDGTVVDGHLRLKAAKKLGLTEVPVVLADDMTDLQIKAFRLSVNKMAELAEWDDELLAIEFAELADAGFDNLLTGFTQEEIDALTPGDDNDEKEPGEASGAGSLAARFMLPPFTVLNTREGWWQDRKRAWLALGIKSELGRGDCAPGGGGGVWGHAGPSDKYQRGGANERPDLGQRGGDAARHTKPVPRAEPGGSARPAMNYKNKQRGDGRGRAMQ